LGAGGAFGDFTFVPDGLGAFLAAVATCIGSLAVVFSAAYMKGEAQLGRYYAFVLLFIGSMCGLVLTGSLLLLFFFWEMTALTSYALISFHNDDPKAVAGGIKALIVTQIGGVGLLIGALVAYAAFGSYEIADLLAKAPGLPSGTLALIAFGFLAAAAAKSAQIPFHTWLPDAMEAPTPVSALIHAATMVNAGVYLLARFQPAFAPVPGWNTAVVIVGAATALLAACMAIVANDLKRVLAYSTVSQLGYMVYAIGTGAVLASQFHLFSHAIFKALLFLGAGAVIHAVGTRDMRQMGGLGKRMPVVRATFLIGAVALSGLPIFNGFWSKEYILEVGLRHGPILGYAVMLLTAGLTALYTLRMVSMTFFGPARGEHHAHDAPPAMSIPLIILAAGTTFSWLLFGPFSNQLSDSLPGLEPESTLEFAGAVLADPATWLALAVVGLGLAAWLPHARLAPLGARLGWLAKMAADGFGFEALNRGVARAAQGAGSWLRRSQTGELNWNAAGIVIALAVVLVILGWGR
jgi:NADH-quinone oxidoreductase subunit L